MTNNQMFGVTITAVLVIFIVIALVVLCTLGLYSSRKREKKENQQDILDNMVLGSMTHLVQENKPPITLGDDEELTEEFIRASDFYKKNFKWLTFYDTESEQITGERFIRIFKPFEEYVRKRTISEMDMFLINVKYRIPNESVTVFKDIYHARSGLQGPSIRVILNGLDGYVVAIGKYFPQTGLFQHHDPKEANKRGSWILYNTIIDNVDLTSKVWLSITLGRPY